MKAIVVRKTGTNEIIAFGPDNGMYKPNVPPGCMLFIEPDYNAVLAEEAAQPKPPSVKDLFKADLAQATTIADIKAVLLKYVGTGAF